MGWFFYLDRVPTKHPTGELKMQVELNPKNNSIEQYDNQKIKSSIGERRYYNSIKINGLNVTEVHIEIDCKDYNILPQDCVNGIGYKGYYISTIGEGYIVSFWTGQDDTNNDEIFLKNSNK